MATPHLTSAVRAHKETRRSSTLSGSAALSKMVIATRTARIAMPLPAICRSSCMSSGQIARTFFLIAVYKKDHASLASVQVGTDRNIQPVNRQPHEYHELVSCTSACTRKNTKANTSARSCQESLLLLDEDAGTWPCSSTVFL